MELQKMTNKKTLSIKLNKSFQAPPDAPFTPVEQTLHTPVEIPNHNSYFGLPSLGLQPELSFFSLQHDNDSDDIMTDVDEPLMLLLAPKMIRNYTISFTSTFDQILTDIYSHILLLPTTTPFLGHIPPLGIASRVANETLLKIVADSDPATGKSQTAYDYHGMLNHEQLTSTATTHIILQLIRKRLLDLCASQKLTKSKNGSAPNLGTTTIQVSVPVYGSNNHNSVYSGLALKQLSISNLLLNEHNTANYQQSQAGLAPQSAVLAGSRLRSSSLDLRKHSLTRNNSQSGSSWLHVGNLANVRSGGNLGTNPDFALSTDSLQLMNDFVPHAFLSRQGSSLSNAGHGSGSATMSGFNTMMMDYQTPPSSSKSSVSQGSSSPSIYSREGVCFQIPGSAGSNSDNETMGMSFLRSRSLNRGSNPCSFPKPLTINTDMGQPNNIAQSHASGVTNGEALHSPFVSAVSGLEDFEYFGQGTNLTGSVLENMLPNLGGLRNSAFSFDVQSKDKISIPAQYSLSEKKRESLKLKRGIH